MLLSGSILRFLYTFWGMGFLISMQKGSFFLPRVMWAKLWGKEEFTGPVVKGLGCGS